MIFNYMYKKLEKKGNKIKTKSKENTFSDFDSSKNEVPQELKEALYHDLEDMVNRMQLTYGEIMDALDKKYFPSERTGYTLPPGIYEIGDFNKTPHNLLSDIVKVSFIIDDIRLKSNL